jgi:hypothetical protein
MRRLDGFKCLNVVSCHSPLHHLSNLTHSLSDYLRPDTFTNPIPATRQSTLAISTSDTDTDSIHTIDSIHTTRYDEARRPPFGALDARSSCSSRTCFSS